MVGMPLIRLNGRRAVWHGDDDWEYLDSDHIVSEYLTTDATQFLKNPDGKAGVADAEWLDAEQQRLNYARVRLDLARARLAIRRARLDAVQKCLDAEQKRLDAERRRIHPREG
jgi:hypothetical protein